MPEPADDDVQLTDLEVIQQYSLAVRAQSAPRSEIIQALEADLSWLRSLVARSTSEAFAPPTSKAGGRKPRPRRADSRRRDA